jgi:hypothetical protein
MEALIGHLHCIANWRHAFSIGDTDMAGSIFKIGVQWERVIGINGLMTLQHLAATLVGHGRLTCIRSTSWPSSLLTFPLAIMAKLKTV